MVLAKEDYMKRYIGGVNKARTDFLKNKGVDTSRYSVKATVYKDIFKLIRKKYNDITGYIVGNKIHNTRSTGDRKRVSTKQPWERK